MFARLRSFLVPRLTRGRFERELSQELETHIELLTEDLIKEGLSPKEARRRARAEFGSIESAKEGCRDAAGASFLDALLRDVRLAVRLVAKSPGFTAVVVTILALTIGANAAIFSVVDTALFRGLPYPEPERLVQIRTKVLRGGETSFVRDAQDGRTWQVIRDELGSIHPAVYSGRSTGINLVTEEGARYVQRGRVSSGFFATLLVPPAVGREFTPEEDLPGGPPVALLSHELYRSAFGLDAEVLGRTITLRGEAHTIVGVMPEGFTTHVAADLWTPIRADTDGEGQGTNYSVMGRIPAAMSWAEAESRVRAVSERATEHLDRELPDDATAELAIVSLERALTGDVRLSLIVALGSVFVILLIGCANISGLMMARANGRRREVATRMLLGGGRGVILRQLVTEAVMLSVLGGAVGVLLGYGLMELAAPYVRETLGIWQPMTIDGRVLAVAAALALGSSITWSLAPALSSGRLSLREATSAEGTRSVVGGRSRGSRHALVFFQLASTFVLLVAAGLLTRTLGELDGLEPGFDDGGVLTASFSLDDERYQTKRAVETLFERSLERVSALPSVESAAIGLTVPYETPLNIAMMIDGEQGLTTLIYVTPGYFDTLRMPLLKGRAIEAHDDEGRNVIVVSRAFAEKFFPGQEALGRTVDLMSLSREIVGVVADVPQRPNQFGYGPLAAVPAAYAPVSQFNEVLLGLAHTWFTPSLIARTRAGTTASEIARQMSAVMESVDPLLPFAAFRGFDTMRRQALAQQRFRSQLLSLLAGLALFLAVTGTSGLIARTVAERKRELGIRLALGASRSRAVLGASTPGILLAAAGIVAGAIVAWLAVPLLESFLWNVSPTDPRTFALAALGLLAAAATASLVPALAVTKLDPATTLRSD